METNKIISFGEFYNEIRSHFSQNIHEFEELKKRRSGKKRIEFLLEHQVVQKAVEKLQENGKIVNKVNAVVKAEEISDEPFPPLSTNVDGFKGSSKYPQLSCKIGVQDSKKKGRHLVAKEKIIPGELLIVERPYATTLRSKHLKTHCSNCFHRIQTRHTCQNDCELSYCSENCASRHYRIFHWAECGLLQVIQADDIGFIALMVYRTIVRAGYKTCLEVSETQSSSELENSVIYDSNDYRAAFLQVSHEDERDAGDIFKRIGIGMYLTHFLHQVGFFPPENTEPLFVKTNHATVTIINLILRHLQSCSCNGYEISELVRDGTTIDNLDLGGAVYPTVSLSNHSCVPNTMRHNDGVVCVVRAVATILKGEEVSDNYGHFFQIKSRDERRHDLKSQYFFSCECQACRHHWPLFRDLKSKNESGSPFICSGCKSPVLHPQKAKKCLKCKKELKLGKLSRLMATIFDDARKVLDEVNRENVDKFLSHYVSLLIHMETNLQSPSAELVVCQQVVSQCYAVKGNFHKV